MTNNSEDLLTFFKLLLKLINAFQVFSWKALISFKISSFHNMSASETKIRIIKHKKFLFWPHCVTTGILVPQPGTEPTSPGVEAQSPKPLNHKGSPYKAFRIVQCHMSSLRVQNYYSFFVGMLHGIDTMEQYLHLYCPRI